MIGISWVLPPPPCTTWIVFTYIIVVQIALNITRVLECYRAGAVPKRFSNESRQGKDGNDNGSADAGLMMVAMMTTMLRIWILNPNHFPQTNL